MVLYFNSLTHPERAVVFMGRDAEENANLMDAAYSYDVWFSILPQPIISKINSKLNYDQQAKDNNSFSAQVYLRFDRLNKLEEIPEELIEEACQLVKGFSKDANAQKEVSIVYTFADNLIKPFGCDMSNLKFKHESHCRVVHHVVKNKYILNEMRKSMSESNTQFKVLNPALEPAIKTELKHKHIDKIKSNTKETELKKTIRDSKNSIKRKETE